MGEELYCNTLQYLSISVLSISLLLGLMQVTQTSLRVYKQDGDNRVKGA